jgi:hypothetical protein
MGDEVGGWLAVLRGVVAEDGRSHGEIRGAAGIDAGQFSKFMSGKGSLSLEKAEALCGVLGFRLVRASANLPAVRAQRPGAQRPSVTPSPVPGGPVPAGQKRPLAANQKRLRKNLKMDDGGEGS